MRILREASEDEVVDVFVRAELASDRWREKLAPLVARGLSGRELLAEHRAFGRDEGLFGGFPDDVRWRRAALAPEEVLAIRYIDWDWWVRVSAGTRLATVAADRIRAGSIPGSTAEWHAPIAAALRSDAPPPELIAVREPGGEKLVLLEGHVRLTAYALFPDYLPDELELYLGESERIGGWALF